MEKETIGSIVEALLFASGEAIELSLLAEIIEIDEGDLNEIILDLMDKYNYEKRGIKIIRVGSKYQLCTRS